MKTKFFGTNDQNFWQLKHFVLPTKNGTSNVKNFFKVSPLKVVKCLSIVVDDDTKYFICEKGRWNVQNCGEKNKLKLRFNGTECVDPVLLPLHAQATSGFSIFDQP